MVSESLPSRPGGRRPTSSCATVNPFAIAGLLDNISQEDRSAIPILSKIPIIGHLFRSKAERAEQTELMVLITPRLVQPLDPDEVPPSTRFRPFLSEGAVGEGTGLVDAPTPPRP